jgi:hypothetical protein
MADSMPPMGFPGMSGSTRGARTTTRDGLSIASSEPPPPDWPKQATQQIVTVVDGVRDATTGRALTAARYLVYGTVLALLGVPLLVVLLVGLMRWLEGGLLLLNEKLEWGWLEHPYYLVYLAFGTAFLVAGFSFWRSANRAAPVPPS